jgi:hypothetical protein
MCLTPRVQWLGTVPYLAFSVMWVVFDTLLNRGAISPILRFPEGSFGLNPRVVALS